MVERLRQPEYTGDNRCMACTAVNSVIAVVAAGLGAGVVSVATSTILAIAFGAGILALSALSIWLRGYLVPGTPALTKRYMPPWMLAWFGKEPTPQSVVENDEDETLDGGDIEALLDTAGVVEPCEKADDLCLSEGFARDWRDALAHVEEEVPPDTAVSVLGVDSSEDSLDAHRHGDALVVSTDGRRVAKWPSTAALRADMASAAVLSDRIPEWESFGPAERGQLLNSVRLFLEECPGNESAQLSEETVESCCSTHEVAVVVCSESGDRLFEQPLVES